jgi:hypothetical protein
VEGCDWDSLPDVAFGHCPTLSLVAAAKLAKRAKKLVRTTSWSRRSSRLDWLCKIWLGKIHPKQHLSNFPTDNILLLEQTETFPGFVGWSGVSENSKNSKMSKKDLRKVQNIIFQIMDFLTMIQPKPCVLTNTAVLLSVYTRSLQPRSTL